MTDDNKLDQTPDPTPDPTADPDPAPAAEAPEQPAARTRWRDRALGFRAVAAVALATLVLGGLGGAAIGVVASGDDDHDRRGPAQLDFRDGDRPPHGAPGMPAPDGVVPPGTPPQDDVQPDDSGDTSGDTGSGTNS